MLEAGDVASKLLDGLNLLMQVVALDEVSHLHIFFVVKMGGDKLVRLIPGNRHLRLQSCADPKVTG